MNFKSNMYYILSQDNINNLNSDKKNINGFFERNENSDFGFSENQNSFQDNPKGILGNSMIFEKVLENKDKSIDFNRLMKIKKDLVDINNNEDNDCN